MKRLTLYTALFLITASTGCNKFLDKEPDNRAELTDPQKVSQLLGTAYPRGNYMAFNEAMSDNATDKGAGVIYNQNLDPYFFRDVRQSDQDSPDYYWSACYEAIAAANQALKTISAANDPADYSAQKGEALIARAYAHFSLVTLFAKPYDPASSGNDPGVPYIKEPENVVIKEYTRGTVASVYQDITKDIENGINLIDDKSYDKVRFHFNRAAANAFAARFYLYKKSYDSAVMYANKSVTNFLPNLRPWNTVYQTLDLNELPLEYQKTTQPANLLLVSCPTRYNFNYNYATYRYGMNSPVFTRIFRNPIPVTGGSWSFRNGNIGSQSNIALPKLHMRDFAYETPTSDFGLQYGTIPLLTVEEVLFNKAEANSNIGNTDAAIADLNTYMSTRITGATPGSLMPDRTITPQKILNYYFPLSLKDGLIQLILEYKRAEFAQEGMRWFDILRHNIPVKHDFRLPGNADIRSDTLKIDDRRRQLKIPDAALLSGITDLNR